MAPRPLHCAKHVSFSSLFSGLRRWMATANKTHKETLPASVHGSELKAG